MFDGYEFDGAKVQGLEARLMMMSHLLHVKYHKQTGIAFVDLPRLHRRVPLFREKRARCAAAPNCAEVRPLPRVPPADRPAPPAPSQVPQVLSS